MRVMCIVLATLISVPSFAADKKRDAFGDLVQQMITDDAKSDCVTQQAAAKAFHKKPVECKK